MFYVLFIVLCSCSIYNSMFMLGNLCSMFYFLERNEWISSFWNLLSWSLAGFLKWNSACLLISSWSSQSLPSESKRCLFLLGCPKRVLQQPLPMKSYNNPWFSIFDYNSIPFGAWSITNIFVPLTSRKSNPSFFCLFYQVRMIDPQVIWKEKNWVLNLLKFPN